VTKFASQQQVKPTQHKKQEKANVDEKIEYARSVEGPEKVTRGG
jgi:hypothetical protein